MLMLTRYLFDHNKKKPAQTIWICTIIGFIVLLLSCSRAIFSIYMPDDYLLSMTHMPVAFYMQQGRFVQGAFTWLFNSLNITIISSAPVFIPLFLFFSSLSAAMIVCSLSGNQTPVIISILCTLVIVSHPVFSMMAVYHLAAICFAFCFFCVAFYIHTFQNFEHRPSRLGSFFSIAFIILICGNYQPAFIVVTAYTLFISLNKKQNIKSFMINITPLIIGFICYLLLFKLTKNAFGLNQWDSRASLVTNVYQRYQDIINFIPQLFWDNWWVIPAIYARLLSLCVLIFFFAALYKTPFQALRTPLLLILGILGAIAPLAILEHWDTTPRALVAIPFIFGMTLAYINDNSSLRILKITVLSITVLIGIISTNSYLYITEREYLQDKWIAENITKDILARQIEDQEITIVNTSKKVSIDDWAMEGLFEFTTNIPLNIKTPVEQDKMQCKDGKVWPSDESWLQTETNGKQKTIICI